MSREPAYRQTIRSIYEERVSRNSQYSLRAFARDLSILPSRLNEILKGRCGLSPKAGKALARRLGLNEIESRDFVDEVEALHARGKLQKKIARNRMASRESEKVLNLQVDQFRVISDWWHFAIIELMGTQHFKSDASWIADRLGLTPNIIIDALYRLEALGLVKKVISSDGSYHWIPSQENRSVGGAAPSEAIRKFHRQILERAQRAIDLQTPDERVLGATLMPVRKECVAEAAQALIEFRKAFNKRFGAEGTADSVYCLSLQFFELTQRDKGKSK